MLVLPNFNTKKSEVGIDKLHLTTQDFKVENIDSLGLKPHIKKQDENEISDTSLFTTTSGNNVVASGAFYNTDLYNLSINPKGLYINLNPSKFYHPYELNTSLKKVDEAVSYAIKDLKSKGVYFDAHDCRVSRTDLTRQFELQNPVHQYAHTMAMFKAKRASNTMYPNASSWSNKSVEAVMYDKGLKHALDHKLKGINTNYARFELKYKTGKSMANHLKRNSYSELLKTDEKFLFDSYVNHWQNNIFKTLPKEQLTFDFGSQVKLLRSMRESGRGGLMNYVATKGIDTLINDLGGWTGIQSFLMQGGYDEKYTYRQISKLKNLWDIARMNRKQTNQQTNMDLYTEIIEKLAS